MTTQIMMHQRNWKIFAQGDSSASSSLTCSAVCLLLYAIHSRLETSWNCLPCSKHLNAKCCCHVSWFQSDFAQNVKSCYWIANNSFNVTSQNIRFCIKKPVPYIYSNWSAWWLLINYHWINCKRKLNVLWLPVIYKQVRILYLVWAPPLMILV